MSVRKDIDRADPGLNKRRDYHLKSYFTPHKTGDRSAQTSKSSTP